MPFQRITTRRGYDGGEVISALQKCVRRGLVDDALYWAVELDNSGYGAWCWRRLTIMVSEDVGPAWPEGPAVIRALREDYEQMAKKKDDAQRPWRLKLVHAVILLASAPKSRVCDWALLHHYSDEVERREIPDVALDKHTGAGKRKRRGWDHFFEEGTELHPHEPTMLEKIYRAHARELLVEGKDDGENPWPAPTTGQLVMPE